MPRYQLGNFAQNLVLVAKFEHLAQAQGIPPTQLARGVVAILGTKRAKYLEANVAAASSPLSAADLTELDASLPVGSAAGAAC